MNTKQYADKINTYKHLLRSMVITVFLLSLAVVITILFAIFSFHREKIILVPPTIDKKIAVSGNTVNPSYLVIMADFLLSKKLNVTPNNVKQSYNLILSYVSPAYYHSFSSKLMKDATIIKNDKVSAAFFPNKVKPYPNKMSVIITGNLHKFVGIRALKAVKVSYEVKFTMSSGVLTLKSIEKVKVKDNV